MISKFHYYLFGVFALASTKLLALPVFDINESSNPITINNNLYYYTAAADETIEYNKVSFQSKKREVNIFKEQIVWTGFSIKNKSNHAEEVYLEIRNDSLHRIDIYVLKNGELTKMHTGLAVDPSMNASIYRWPVIPFKVNSGAELTVYLKIHQQITFSGPIILQKKSQFEKKITYEYLRYGIMYGTLAILLGYMVFAYLRMKEPVFFNLFFTITSFAVFLMALDSIPDRTWLFHLFTGSHLIVYGMISLGIMTVFFTQRLLYSLISPQIPGPMILRSGRLLQISVILCSIYILINFERGIYIAGWFSIIWSTYLFALGIYYSIQIQAFMGFIAAGMLFLAPILFPLCFPGYDLYVQIAEWNPWVRLSATPAALLITIGVMHKISRTHKQYFKYLEELVDNRTKELLNETRNATEAKELKEQVLRIVSHDMRSPLSAIQANIPLIENTSVPEKTKNLLIDNIKSTVRELIRMSDWLIQTSEIRESKSKIEPEWINLHNLAESVFSKHELPATRKEIKLANRIHTMTEILADPSLASQMMNNLIGNAVKFCSKEDHISVYQKETSILIEDTGKGLSSDAVAKFNNKENLTSTPGSANEPGTGLGLSITREIVQQHDGFLTVHSTMNQGATFSIQLPAWRFASGKHRPPIVLIVDDDPDLRSLIKKYINELNIAVVEAGDGNQALRILKKLNVKLVISDLNMPHVDGIALFQNIKNHQVKGSPKFCLMSAYEKKHPEYKAAIKAGIVKILPKPIDPQELARYLSIIS